MILDREVVIAQTRHWISTVVIELNLCPFARRVFEADLIRFVVTDATDRQGLFQVLSDELQVLASLPIGSVETTLVIHPCALADFMDYSEFLFDADRLICQLGLTGTIQIASFHPAYQFAGTEPDAVENYTNRSPYPMLHLLREESVTQAVGERGKLDEIPERNIATLKALGTARMLEILRAIKRDVQLLP